MIILLVNRVRILFRRFVFRRWIKRELEIRGGEEYLKALERDIGLEEGFFRAQCVKSVFRE